MRRKGDIGADLSVFVDKSGSNWPGDKNIVGGGLTLLGDLQLEIVDIHLEGFIARRQIVDVSLYSFHSRKKSWRVRLSRVFERVLRPLTSLGGPLARTLFPWGIHGGKRLQPVIGGNILYHLFLHNGILYDISWILLGLSPGNVPPFQRHKRHDLGFD